jgi:hypothetical protein
MGTTKPAADREARDGTDSPEQIAQAAADRAKSE